MSIHAVRGDLPLHEHKLISPLINYHGRILKTFQELPKEGRLQEIIKRICYVIAAPFCYLILSLTALLGWIHDKTFSTNLSQSEDDEFEVIADERIFFQPAHRSGLEGLYHAVGGRRVYEAIPVIETFDGQLNIDEYTTPILKGSHGDGKIFVIFCYLKSVPHGDDQLDVQAEYIGWNPNLETWSGFCHGDPQLNFGAHIVKGTLLEQMLFDRIKRLRSQQPLGLLQHYPNIGNEKPEDKNLYRPDDSYLTGGDLEAFMDEDCLLYEVRPPENGSHVTLGIAPR